MKIFAASDSMEKPTIITDVPCQVENKNTEKKQTMVKYIVGGVVVVCITIAVVAGFLFAFKMHADSTTNIIKKTFNVEGQKETLEEDKNEHTRLFTVEAEGATMYVLYDFNRRLRLVKTQGICFVNAMNATREDIESQNGDPDSEYMYKAYSQPVSDKSFLAKQGQNLCKDTDVYWTFPDCTAAGEESKEISNEKESDKQKRQLRQVFWCDVPKLPGGYCYLGACGRVLRLWYPCTRLYMVRWIWSNGRHQCWWYAACPR